MAKKNDVIEATAEELMDQENTSEETSTEEKGLEKAHPVKAFLGGVKKAVTSVPGKIITGVVIISGAVIAIGYAAAKMSENAGPTGAEAFLGTGDGTGNDQSASENTEN